MFSRVDGNLSEEELVVCTGLEALVVAEALDRLASFGALSFSERVPKQSGAPQATRSAAPPVTRSDSPPGAPTVAPPKATPTDPPRTGSPAPRTVSPPSRAGAPRSVAPQSHTGAPPGRVSAPAIRSQFMSPPAASGLPGPLSAPPGASTRPGSFTTPPGMSGRPGPLATSSPPRGSVSPSGAPRAITPVPTTYRPGSLRPEYHDQLRRYLEGARTAIDEGNAAAAANYYRLAQQMAPADPTIIAALAQCNNVSAEVRASSDRAVTLVLLGDNAARSKQWGVAAQAYEEALALIPKDPAVLYKFAGALYRCGGHLAQAGRLVEQSIAISRNRVEVWLLLSQIRWEQGQRVAAREAAEEARRLRPDDERVVKLLMKLGTDP